MNSWKKIITSYWFRKPDSGFIVFQQKRWWIDSEFLIFANSLSIHHHFREFKKNSLSISRVQNEFTIYFASSKWIHYLFRDFKMNSQSVSRIHFEFLIFANSLLIHHLFRELKKNSLSISRYHYEFTKNSLWIHYLFREFKINSISFSWIQNAFNISFANSKWIHYFFAISLSFSRIHFEFTMNSLSI